MESEDNDEHNANHNVGISEMQWQVYEGKQADITFVGQAGIQTNISVDATPMEVYKLFLNEDVLNLIVTETNRYAQSVISNSVLSRSSRLHSWEDTNIEEIEKFLGIIIWMGLNIRPKLSDYWSTDPLYENIVSKQMTRNRFEILLRMLHFSDNSIPNENDRLRKINPLLNLLQSTFQEVYTIGKKMVIDESMVPWRGRLSFRQYIPGKRHKYGVKLFKICSPDGFTWKIQIYCGKSEGSGSGLAEKVVMHLCEGLLEEGRILYTDNFYTSIPLAKNLLSKKTHLVGTLRKNRKYIPKEVLNRKLNIDEFYGLESNEGIVVSKWKPKKNKDVLMLSTLHNLDKCPVPTKRRRLLSEEEPVREKPAVIVDYNNGKIGIDKSDQLSSYCTSIRKGIKWYRKVAFELLTGVAIVNAHIIYKLQTKTKITITAFREKICRNLLGLENRERVKAVKVKHLLKKRNAGGTKDRRNCVSCYDNLVKNLPRSEARKKVRKVKTYCDGCDNKPTICYECHVRIHGGNT